MLVLRCVLVVLGVCGALLACESSARNERSLSDKCEALVEACAGLKNPEYSACYDIGTKGVKQASNRAQCFTAYDNCVDECLWAAAQPGAFSTDSGAADSGAADSGASE